MAKLQKVKSTARIRIRKNDQVVVRAGKDRGKRGRVLQVVPDTNRVVVEGVNLIKRHTTPQPAEEHQGRDRRARSGDSRQQRDADRSRDQRADAHRQQEAR